MNKELPDENRKESTNNKGVRGRPRETVEMITN